MVSRWSIGMYRGATPFSLQPVGDDIAVLTPEFVSDIRCKTVADPFLLRRDNRWYLFFEAWNDAVSRGEIGVATSDDCLHWQYAGIVMRESFHLSYPQVFEHQGSVYMIPETRQAGCVRLYVARRFPDDWILYAVLLEGDYADATILQFEGKWNLFAQRGLDEMRLSRSISLESGWAEHPGNPFWPANRTYCRPGGRILEFEGAWYRFVQDGLTSYGNNLRALRIDELSDTALVEHEISQSPVLGPSRKGWNALGMHHLDAVEIWPGEWLGAADGLTFQ